MGNQVAVAIHVRVFIVQPQPDPPRVGARIHGQIIFQFAAVAVVSQIDALVKSRHFQPAKVSNRVPPFGSLAAEIQIRRRPQKLLPLHLGRRIRAIEAQPDVFMPAAQDRLMRAEFKSEARSPSDKFRLALAPRGLKPQWRGTQRSDRARFSSHEIRAGR